MLKTVLDSKVAQTLGVSLVFIGISWIVWTQMNRHIDGRFEAQDSRISDLAEMNKFHREFAIEEQRHRETLFTAIEEHLGQIVKYRTANND